MLRVTEVHVSRVAGGKVYGFKTGVMGGKVFLGTLTVPEGTPADEAKRQLLAELAARGLRERTKQG